MSLYAKAWLFIAWTMGVLATLPYWQPFLQSIFGPSGTTIALTFWVGHGLIALFVFVCPDCSFSLFRSEGRFFKANHPWPNKICSRCGRDHSS